MVNTRHIYKNGLSFDCPDYYDIGKYPSSDEAHKSMVALSKHDRKCEIYVTVYRKKAFDDNAKRNNYLLKEYLKRQGYRNIRENKNLPYCFNGNITHQAGNIKTTLVYNFDHDDVIMVVGNIRASSNYDCTDDIKIILDTIQQENIIKRAKRKVTSKNKTIMGIISIIINFSAYILFQYYDLSLVLIGILPAIFLIIPESIKSSRFLSVCTLIICIPFFAAYGYGLLDSIGYVLSGYPIDNLFIEQTFGVIVWFINIFCALLLYVPTDSKRDNESQNVCKQCGNTLKNNANYCEKCGEKTDNIANEKLNDEQNQEYGINEKKTLKYYLFYWEDSDTTWRLSKTKIVSLVIFIFTALYIISININEFEYALISFSLFISLIVTIPIFIIGCICHYLIKRRNDSLEA